MTRRAILIAWVLAGLVFGCSKRESDQSTDPEAVVPVRLGQLRTMEFADGVDAAGQWKSSGELAVTAPYAMVLESLSSRVGDTVDAGQTLGTYATVESYSALRGARQLAQQAKDEASRAEARRAIQLAERDLVHVSIVAAQAGIVLRRSAEPGAQVAEGGEIVAIAPWHTIGFEAHLAPSFIGAIRVGQPAVVTVPDRPPRAVRVNRVLPTVGETDQAELVWLEPLTKTPAPELGRFGSATIRIGPVHPATAVPDSAVVEDDVNGTYRIAVVDGSNHIHWTVVTLGATSESWREIRAPALSSGTRIVVDGQTGLADSTRVSDAP
jgi:multidrug efflux pump subunit AcrA (membrane-fusion protein)